MNDLTIIIVNYNTKKLTSHAIDSIYSRKWAIKIKTVLVDNNSNDGSVTYIKKRFPHINIIQSKSNLGFAGGNNLALKNISSDYVLLLNSDTEVLNYSLDRLFNFAKNEGFDIASCKLLNSDKTIQPNTGDLPGFWSIFNWISGLDSILYYYPSFHHSSKLLYLEKSQVGWVSGAVMLVKKEVFDKVGFFDNKIFMYMEDVDFCQRAFMSGYKVGWTPDAEIIHLGGGSSKDPKYSQWLGEFSGILYLYRKYHGLFKMWMLKVLLYTFIILRIIAYFILGKFSYSKTYAKIAVSI